MTAPPAVPAPPLPAAPATRADIVRRLGEAGVPPPRAERYLVTLRRFLTAKTSKVVFEEELRSVLPPAGVAAHNGLIRELLRASQAPTPGVSDLPPLLLAKDKRPLPRQPDKAPKKLDRRGAKRRPPHPASGAPGRGVGLGVGAPPVAGGGGGVGPGGSGGVAAATAAAAAATAEAAAKAAIATANETVAVAAGQHTLGPVARAGATPLLKKNPNKPTARQLNAARLAVASAVTADGGSAAAGGGGGAKVAAAGHSGAEAHCPPGTAGANGVMHPAGVKAAAVGAFAGAAAARAAAAGKGRAGPPLAKRPRLETEKQRRAAATAAAAQAAAATAAQAHAAAAAAALPPPTTGGATSTWTADGGEGSSSSLPHPTYGGLDVDLFLRLRARVKAVVSGAPDKHLGVKDDAVALLAAAVEVRVKTLLEATARRRAAQAGDASNTGTESDVFRAALAPGHLRDASLRNRRLLGRNAGVDLERLVLAIR
ncbi:hypothetical protein I4F81_012041 [Pyropia yezoensis]|uniref:Uncharacterized protein n=1 Tax=Pyropia yezoensis TaxID=2788 RepID=A0ACC3CHB4_PYRYE|nr:hypothetical protein I4F81_012041 [Neopyropia yezoensis]